MMQINKIPLEPIIQQQLDSKTTTNWKLLTDNQREEITSKLMESQKGLCCYCECELKEEDIHIEHFFERQDCPSKTYDYQNLFLSCTKNIESKRKNETEQEKEERLSRITCGHNKTASYHGGIRIDYNLLLNPKDNINNEFIYPTGKIDANNKPNEKANYTINRLNLQSQKLINNREMAVTELGKEIIEIEKRNPADVKIYLSDLFDKSKSKLPAFISTLEYNFSFLL